jgi:hypothetical protein
MLFQQQNYIKSFWEDSHVKALKFFIVPRTDSIPIFKGATDGLVKLQKFWFYQAISSTLKIWKESVPGTMENFNTLKQLSASEDFI